MGVRLVRSETLAGSSELVQSFVKALSRSLDCSSLEMSKGFDGNLPR